MRQVVKYELRLPAGKKLEIRARAYRSNKLSRQGNNELILPTYLLLQPVKEVSFKFARKRRFRRSSARQKLQIARSLFSFGFISLGLAGVIYFSAENKETQSIQPQSTFSVPTGSPKTTQQSSGLTRSEPKAVKIGSIDLDVPVKKVGRKADKTMEVPPLFEHVTGWYKLGPSPGEIGPAVIVGHVDTYKGPSVFYRLRDLKAGDIIEVVRTDQKKVKFKVTGLKQFSQYEFPTKEVYGDIDYAGLRLITCGGTFNQQTQRYSDNTVVFAQMVKT